MYEMLPKGGKDKINSEFKNAVAPVSVNVDNKEIKLYHSTFDDFKEIDNTRPFYTTNDTDYSKKYHQ